MLDIFFRTRRPMKCCRSVENSHFVPTKMLPVWCVVGSNFMSKQLIIKPPQLLHSCREFHAVGIWHEQ